MENNQYDMVYRMLFDPHYQRLLSAAGFGDIYIYGGCNMEDYTENSRRLIVTARRTN